MQRLLLLHGVGIQDSGQEVLPCAASTPPANQSDSTCVLIAAGVYLHGLSDSMSARPARETGQIMVVNKTKMLAGMLNNDLCHTPAQARLHGMHDDYFAWRPGMTCSGQHAKHASGLESADAHVGVQA